MAHRVGATVGSSNWGGEVILGKKEGRGGEGGREREKGKRTLEQIKRACRGNSPFAFPTHSTNTRSRGLTPT